MIAAGVFKISFWLFKKNLMHSLKSTAVLVKNKFLRNLLVIQIPRNYYDKVKELLFYKMQHGFNTKYKIC